MGEIRDCRAGRYLGQRSLILDQRGTLSRSPSRQKQELGACSPHPPRSWLRAPPKHLRLYLQGSWVPKGQLCLLLNDMGFGMRAADLLVLGKLPTKVLTSAAVGERERFLGPRAGLNFPPQLCGCKELSHPNGNSWSHTL